MIACADNDIKTLTEMLAEETDSGMEQLFLEARRIRREVAGDVVYLRGLIEVSNICEKNCLYCGIRAGNSKVARYQMDAEEILDACRWADAHRFGSVVLQAGERSGPEYAAWIADIISRIKSLSNGRLRITLSLGEQEEDVYRLWHDAGAERYLLRIETSSKALYESMHPANHDFENRLRCLRDLKQLGYQTGTGVMIGLPGQDYEDLARDILFFRDIDADMIGMGPYLFHGDTPLGRKHGAPDRERQLALGLKMIAVTRIFLKNVNIASTTALEAIHPDGRELGINAGANVVMPNLSSTSRRPDYCLYDGKPGVNGDAVQSLNKVVEGIEQAGCAVGWGEWGDSAHFAVRKDGRAC